MDVELVEWTHNATALCNASAHTCYSANSMEQIFTDDMKKDSPKYSALKHAIKSGHFSVLEHASFTFSISGISRACSHQLVRHRMASFSQQSQRYVKMEDPRYVVPPSIGADPYLLRLYASSMDAIFEEYKNMIKDKIPEEDARYILPNACCTNIVVTMNARELRHFFSLRLCARAQWEIRELAKKMYKAVYAVSPELFEGCGPSCISDGHCNEKKPCGMNATQIKKGWLL